MPIPLTAQTLQKIFPKCAQPQEWVQALLPAMAQYEINSNARVAGFLAQIGHESGQFNCLVENLNYKTAKRLMQIWPKRFPTEEEAQPYVRQPQKLANKVYANRLGNGDVRSGDGYAYRGRGLIQITGRSNYASAGKALGLDLIAQPDLLLQKGPAALSAAWFWSSHGLNALADDETDEAELTDFKEITRRINGGTTDLRMRLALMQAAQVALRSA